MSSYPAPLQKKKNNNQKPENQEKSRRYSGTLELDAQLRVERAA